MSSKLLITALLLLAASTAVGQRRQSLGSTQPVIPSQAYIANPGGNNGNAPVIPSQAYIANPGGNNGNAPVIPSQAYIANPGGNNGNAPVIPSQAYIANPGGNNGNAPVIPSQAYIANPGGNNGNAPVIPSQAYIANPGGGSRSNNTSSSQNSSLSDRNERVYTPAVLAAYKRQQDQFALNTLINGALIIRDLDKGTWWKIPKHLEKFFTAVAGAAKNAAYPQSGGFNYPQIPVNSSSVPRH